VEELEQTADQARGWWEGLVDAGPRLGIAVGILVLGWLLGRAVRWLLARRWGPRRTASFTAVMSKLAGWGVLAAATVVAVTVGFPSVDPVDVIAGLGVVSIAAGFAFQDIFSNLLSGLLLILRQPFVGGDQVKIGEVEGTVRGISIRETEVETFDGQLTLVPNRDVYQNVLSIRTAGPSIRSELLLGCSYEDDLHVAARTALRAVAECEGVLAEPAPEALFVEFGESTVDLELRWWTDPHELVLRGIRHHVVLAVKDAFDREGLSIPWPIRSIDVLHEPHRDGDA
jgi:small-conductance mechanosensitive channel